MSKKLIASGIVLIILGILIIMIPKPNTTNLDTLLSITGHVIGIVGIILAVVGFGTILADRL